MITDSQNFSGDVSVLKAITGQDTLRFEEKNKQGGQGFKPRCMLIVAANESIQTKDYTSGLARRRITVAFNNRVHPSKRRDLITEFTPELPGIINWALEMPTATVEALVRDTSDNVHSLAETYLENLLNTNPLALWLDKEVIYQLGVKTQIGNANSPADTNLYPSYLAFCAGSGIKPLALNRWVNLLLELCNHQLNLPDIRRERDRACKYIHGLAIRLNENGISPVRHAQKNPDFSQKSGTLGTMRDSVGIVSAQNPNIKHSAGFDSTHPPPNSLAMGVSSENDVCVPSVPGAVPTETRMVPNVPSVPSVSLLSRAQKEQQRGEVQHAPF